MDDLSSCDLRKTSKKQRRKDPGASIVAQIVSKTRRVATKSSSQNSGNTKKPRQEHMLSEGVNKTGTRKHPKRYRMRIMKCIFVKSSNFREVGGRGCGLYISRMTWTFTSRGRVCINTCEISAGEIQHYLPPIPETSAAEEGGPSRPSPNLDLGKGVEDTCLVSTDTYCLSEMVWRDLLRSSM